MDPIKEKEIRIFVSSFVQGFAAGFSDRYVLENADPEGTNDMKIHNVFIAELGKEINFFSAVSDTLDSSLGNMLESMAIAIARLNYDVSQCVQGVLYTEQTDFIAELLEKYKRHELRVPETDDYAGISVMKGQAVQRRHESGYCLFDRESGLHYLIELKSGGDLDNKKARSEKEALLEQFCILTNGIRDESKVKILFATPYNRYGEGNPGLQDCARQYFADDELCISKDFWDLVCKSEDGYDVVIDEYRKNAHYIVSALDRIKETYL